MEAQGEKEKDGYPSAQAGDNSAEDSESPSSSDSSESDLAAPPDGGYGWVVVGCCAILNAFTWGINAVSLHHHHPPGPYYTGLRLANMSFHSHMASIWPI